MTNTTTATIPDRLISLVCKWEKVRVWGSIAELRAGRNVAIADLRCLGREPDPELSRENWESHTREEKRATKELEDYDRMLAVVEEERKEIGELLLECAPDLAGTAPKIPEKGPTPEDAVARAERMAGLHGALLDRNRKLEARCAAGPEGVLITTVTETSPAVSIREPGTPHPEAVATTLPTLDDNEIAVLLALNKRRPELLSVATICAIARRSKVTVGKTLKKLRGKGLAIKPGGDDARKGHTITQAGEAALAAMPNLSTSRPQAVRCSSTAG